MSTKTARARRTGRRSPLTTIALLAIVLLGAGLGYGTWDVAMNAAAHEIDVSGERPLMPRFHGAFSAAGLVGGARDGG